MMGCVPGVVGRFMPKSPGPLFSPSPPLLKSVEPSSSAFYCTDVIYSSFSLRFIHYTFWCEGPFTFAINRTSFIKSNQALLIF